MDRPPLGMPSFSAGNEAEMLAELERAKQASKAACLLEIGTHLDGFKTQNPSGSYEEWILQLHPESKRADGSIDHRYFLEDSDHLMLWNQKVGAQNPVPARDPGTQVAGAPDLAVPQLPPLPLWPNSALEGFQTYGGLPLGYRPPLQAPHLNRSYIPPPRDHIVPRPASWLPPPPAPAGNPAWSGNNRSYVAPIDPLQQQRARSFIAPIDPLSATMAASPLAPSSWLPPRSVQNAPRPLMRADSRMGGASSGLVGSERFMQDTLMPSRQQMPLMPAPPAHWPPQAAQPYAGGQVHPGRPAMVSPFQGSTQPQPPTLGPAFQGSGAAASMAPWPVAMPTAVGASPALSGMSDMRRPGTCVVPYAGAGYAGAGPHGPGMVRLRAS